MHASPHPSSALSVLLLGLAISLPFVITGCSGSEPVLASPVGPEDPLDVDPPVEPLEFLRFDRSLKRHLAGESFGEQFVVSLIDEQDEHVCREYEVTLSLVDPAGRAALKGETTVQLIDGRAVFGDVFIDRAGTNLKLVASIADLYEVESDPFEAGVGPGKRHVILIIADGWGYKQIEAANLYLGLKQANFGGLQSVGMTTGDQGTKDSGMGVIYDPAEFWANFNYGNGPPWPTDSASSATAMYTGKKTYSGRIGVGPTLPPEKFISIGDIALRNGLGSGAVSSVPISHATPGAWTSHNDSRGNYLEIADEAFFGDPFATSAGWGSHGGTDFLNDVLIGGGDPNSGGWFVSEDQIKKVKAETNTARGWTYVSRHPQTAAGVNAMMSLSADSKTRRLLGLFGSSAGNIEPRLANGSGKDVRDPTLAQMSKAALNVLSRRPKGFCLMIEAGAIDWAGHANMMDIMLGEMFDLYGAVATVVSWIEDKNNGSNWQNTLLIVTGDHETGYLTKGPQVAASFPLGEVSPRTLLLEKAVSVPVNATASWDDTNNNGEIDVGEKVHWAWNSFGHSNSLVPCFFRGAESDRLKALATGKDPVRGAYLDNTDLFQVMLAVLRR